MRLSCDTNYSKQLLQHKNSNTESYHSSTPHSKKREEPLWNHLPCHLKEKFGKEFEIKTKLMTTTKTKRFLKLIYQHQHNQAKAKYNYNCVEVRNFSNLSSGRKRFPRAFSIPKMQVFMIAIQNTDQPRTLSLRMHGSPTRVFVKSTTFLIYSI